MQHNILNTRIQCQARTVKLNGNGRIVPTSFAVSGTAGLTSPLGERPRIQKARHDESSKRAWSQAQNGKRTDRLLAVANFRSHASFLTANFSTPFSGSFRTHFVVFSKRDCSVASSGIRPECVMASLCPHSHERKEAPAIPVF